MRREIAALEARKTALARTVAALRLEEATARVAAARRNVAALDDKATSTEEDESEEADEVEGMAEETAAEEEMAAANGERGGWTTKRASATSAVEASGDATSSKPPNDPPPSPPSPSFVVPSSSSSSSSASSSSCSSSSSSDDPADNHRSRVQFLDPDSDARDSSSDSDASDVDVNEWAERWEREQWERRRRVQLERDPDPDLDPDTDPDRFARRRPFSSRSTMGRVATGASDASGGGGRVLNAANFERLLRADVEDRVGDDDDDGRARGPCRACPPHARCHAFARRGRWTRGPQLPLAAARAATAAAAVSVSVSVSASSTDVAGFAAAAAASAAFRDAATRLATRPDGAVCARCGCDASSHATRRETAASRRAAAAAASAAASASAARASRVAAAASRARRAAREGLLLHETNVDAMTGAVRVACGDCGAARCPAFRVAYLDEDTLDPEVMLHCSTCGCASSAHDTCPKWRAEAAAREAAGRRRAEEEAAARRRTRAAEEAARDGGGDARARDLRALGLDARGASGDPTDAEVTRAYRRAALRYHPDKQGGDEDARERATAMFVAATEAFERLTRRGRE